MELQNQEIRELEASTFHQAEVIVSIEDITGSIQMQYWRISLTTAAIKVVISK